MTNLQMNDKTELARILVSILCDHNGRLVICEFARLQVKLNSIHCYTTADDIQLSTSAPSKTHELSDNRGKPARHMHAIFVQSSELSH